MSEKAVAENVGTQILEEPEVSIVVPVYNEEGTVEHLTRELFRVLADERFELILVNDGSKDRTGSLLLELAQAHPEVVVVELSRNFGQHPAVVAGFSLGARQVRRDARRRSAEPARRDSAAPRAAPLRA